MQIMLAMLWLKFVLGLMFFELVSILFAIFPEYGNEYTTKENKNWTSFKNFAPKLNVNHNSYITWHLHQPIVEYNNSVIGKHFLEAHGDTNLKESHILQKCQGKFDCHVYEMLHIKERDPILNTQTDCICAKLFAWKNILIPVSLPLFNIVFT